MRNREVGNTGVEVSVVGVGGWQMGGPDTPDGIGHGWGDVDDKRSIKIIHRAQELGVNLIDTADIYGKGHSEQVIGDALEGRRDRWIVATKGGLAKDPKKRGSTSTGRRNTSGRRARIVYVDSGPTMWTSTNCTGCPRASM